MFLVTVPAMSNEIGTRIYCIATAMKANTHENPDINWGE